MIGPKTMKYGRQIRVHQSPNYPLINLHVLWYVLLNSTQSLWFILKDKLKVM